MHVLGTIVKPSRLYSRHEFYRWLVKEQRVKEALLVLSKINHHSQKETFANTMLELEELRSSINGDLNMSAQFKELFKYKNR